MAYTNAMGANVIFFDKTRQFRHHNKPLFHSEYKIRTNRDSPWTTPDTAVTTSKRTSNQKS